MNKIEIRLDKKSTLTTIAFLTFCVIGSTYFVYLTDTYADNQILRYVMGPLNLVMLYYVYKLVIKLLDKEVVLTLTQDTLEINKGGRPTIIKWTDIKDLKINTDKNEGTSSLTIVTNSTTDTFDITGLNKNPDELKKLMDSLR